MKSEYKPLIENAKIIESECRDVINKNNSTIGILLGFFLGVIVAFLGNIIIQLAYDLWIKTFDNTLKKLLFLALLTFLVGFCFGAIKQLKLIKKENKSHKKALGRLLEERRRFEELSIRRIELEKKLKKQK